MLFKEYLNMLNKLVISNIDNEGNDFRECYFAPSLGYYKDREFIEKSMLKDNQVCNAICID